MSEPVPMEVDVYDSDLQNPDGFGDQKFEQGVAEDEQRRQEQGEYLAAAEALEAEREEEKINEALAAGEELLAAELGASTLDVVSAAQRIEFVVHNGGKVMYRDSDGTESPFENVDGTAFAVQPTRIEVDFRGPEYGGSVRVLAGSEHQGDQVVYIFYEQTYRPPEYEKNVFDDSFDEEITAPAEDLLVSTEASLMEPAPKAAASVAKREISFATFGELFVNTEAATAPERTIVTMIAPIPENGDQKKYEELLSVLPEAIVVIGQSENRVYTPAEVIANVSSSVAGTEILIPGETDVDAGKLRDALSLRKTSDGQVEVVFYNVSDTLPSIRQEQRAMSEVASVAESLSPHQESPALVRQIHTEPMATPLAVEVPVPREGYLMIDINEHLEPAVREQPVAHNENIKPAREFLRPHQMTHVESSSFVHQDQPVDAAVRLPQPMSEATETLVADLLNQSPVIATPGPIGQAHDSQPVSVAESPHEVTTAISAPGKPSPVFPEPVLSYPSGPQLENHEQLATQPALERVTELPGGVEGSVEEGVILTHDEAVVGSPLAKHKNTKPKRDLLRPETALDSADAPEVDKADRLPLKKTTVTAATLAPAQPHFASAVTTGPNNSRSVEASDQAKVLADRETMPESMVAVAKRKELPTTAPFLAETSEASRERNPEAPAETAVVYPVRLDIREAGQPRSLGVIPDEQADESEAPATPAPRLYSPPPRAAAVAANNE